MWLSSHLVWAVHELGLTALVLMVLNVFQKGKDRLSHHTWVCVIICVIICHCSRDQLIWKWEWPLRALVTPLVEGPLLGLLSGNYSKRSHANPQCKLMFYASDNPAWKWQMEASHECSVSINNISHSFSPCPLIQKVCWILKCWQLLKWSVSL